MQALQAYEKAWGPEHPSVAIACNVLALCMQDQVHVGWWQSHLSQLKFSLVHAFVVFGEQECLRDWIDDGAPVAPPVRASLRARGCTTRSE